MASIYITIYVLMQCREMRRNKEKNIFLDSINNKTYNDKKVRGIMMKFSKQLPALLLLALFLVACDFGIPPEEENLIEPEIIDTILSGN